MISTHSSEVATVDKVRETVLERCLPEVRLQAKLRQYLKTKRRKLFIKEIRSKRENCQKNKVKNRKKRLKLTRTVE